MKRWLIWLGVGVFLMFTFPTKPAVGDPWATLDSILFVGWLIITIPAVPIAIIYWLVRGGARRRETASSIVSR